MAERQPLNATFFAFQKRERGGVLLRTSLATFVLGALLVGAFLALCWSALIPFVTWYGEVITAAVANDPAAIAEVGFPTGIFTLVLGGLVFTFFFYLLFAAYEAACLRWLIHNETVGLFGLSLGAPTWRVWGVYWFWLLLNFAFSMVMSMLLGAAIAVMAISSGGDPAAMMTLLPVYYVLQYALLIYFGVRFAPAAATSIARRRFSFFEAWTVTRGRFLPLLGSFMLIWLMYMAASLLLSGVWLGVLLGPAISQLPALSDQAEMGAAMSELLQTYVQALANPQSWIVVGVLAVVGAVVALLFCVASYGVNARAALAALEEGKITPA